MKKKTTNGCYARDAVEGVMEVGGDSGIERLIDVVRLELLSSGEPEVVSLRSKENELRRRNLIPGVVRRYDRSSW